MDKLATGAKPPVDGGTDTHTQSGALRWGFAMRYESDEQQQDQFRRHLMQTEPLADFEAFAQASRALPESHWRGGPEWLGMMSPQAVALLGAFDELKDADLELALKLSAIVAVGVTSRYEFHRQLAARLQTWLSDPAYPVATRVDLGWLLLEHWPNATKAAMEALVLRLLVEESAIDPLRVRAIIEPGRIEKDRYTYLLSSNDDRYQMLALGRNMRAVYPGLAAAMFLGFIETARYFKSQVDIEDALAREVAAELFEITGATPEPDRWKVARAYCALLRFGHRDASWYAAAAPAAFAATRQIERVEWEMGNYLVIAVNALDDATAAQALVQYAAAIGQRAEHDVGRDLVAHLGSLREANKAGAIRNVDLPPCPGHPANALIIGTFWERVEVLLRDRPQGAAYMLEQGVRSRDPELADPAVERLLQVFPQLAGSVPAAADRLLESMAQMTMDSGSNSERQRHFHRLYDQLLPVMQAIAPGVANPAKHFYNFLHER